MSPLFLSHREFIYTRLLAATWQSNVAMPAVCTSSAGRLLIEWMQVASNVSTIVLDCSGISTIEDHAFSEMESYLQQNEKLVTLFTKDGNDQLLTEIDSELRSVRVSTETIGDIQFQLYGSQKIAKAMRHSLERLINQVRDLEQVFLEQAVKDCYREFEKPERLDSTPLIASGVLNARSLISDPVKFVWISLALTDLFQNVLEQAKPRTNRILAVSLRGSPFAAAIRLLAHAYTPSLEVIDHIGPKHDLLEGSFFGHPEMYGGDYVLVGDFVIGGTEIKIARAYAMSQGATLSNAIAIGSFLPGNEYDKNVQLRSLVSISSLVPQLRYEFAPSGEHK